MDKKYRKGVIFGVLFLVFLFIIDVILYYLERNAPDSNIHSLGDAIWYMFVTLTSVGYGDIVPVTSGGKVIGYILVILSVVVLGVLISSFATNIMTMIEEKKLGYRGTDFVNHIVCIGWNDFSRMVIEEVMAANRKVAIVTDRKDDVDFIYTQYGRENVFVLYAELHNIEILKHANADKASDTFLSFDDDTETLIYVINFQKAYPKPNLVVAIHNHKLIDTFLKTGVKHVVARNEIASKLVASYVFEPDVADLNIDLLSSASDDEDFDNQQYLVTEKNPYLNKNYDDAFVALKLKYNIVLLGIVKMIDDKPQLIVNARSDTIIELNDYLIIMVGGKMKKRVEKIFGIHEGKIHVVA